MSNEIPVEELARQRDATIDRLRELQRKRQTAGPIESGPLDTVIMTVEEEIRRLDALIRARVSMK
jgi:hypothetical protein